MKPAWALGLAVAIAFSQQNGGPPVAPEEPILRISVNLVQVDAVVTDSTGHQVTNLTADDFQILEDGGPQKITALSYVKTAGPQPAVAAPAARVKNPVALPLPPAPRLTRQQVRRTVVLMVDDLGLSFESTFYVRRALTKFVDSDMREGDLVAIVRASAGMGSLQQFTADKRVLYEAIERVRWRALGHGSIGIFPALGSDPTARAKAILRGGPPGSPGNHLPKRLMLSTSDDCFVMASQLGEVASTPQFSAYPNRTVALLSMIARPRAPQGILHENHACAALRRLDHCLRLSFVSTLPHALSGVQKQLHQ